jgi:hydrogenase-4 component E
MSASVEPLLVLILMLNFLLLGTSQLRTAISSSALQGAVLGVLTVCVHGDPSARSYLVGAATVAIKGVFIPAMLNRALRDAAIRREIEPYVSFVTSLILPRSRPCSPGS